MVNKPVWMAVAAILFLGMVILADRLGLRRADSRGWQTCLFYAVFCAAILLTLVILQHGLSILADTPVALAFLLIGALAGVIVGLLESFIFRRLPS